jgi:hypothetical protein
MCVIPLHKISVVYRVACDSIADTWNWHPGVSPLTLVGNSNLARAVAASSAGHIHQYCDVTGYVPPQNKFELKLPLPGEWNHKFFSMRVAPFVAASLATPATLVWSVVMPQ